MGGYGPKATTASTGPPKPLFWIASSRKDFQRFPEQVMDVVGHALRIAQRGGKHDDAKPLKGFGGAGVLEVVEDFAGNSYRAVYTVKFERAIYVLHAFQKKSKIGIKTSKRDLHIVKERLRRAEQEHASRSKSSE